MMAQETMMEKQEENNERQDVVQKHEHKHDEHSHANAEHEHTKTEHKDEEVKTEIKGQESKTLPASPEDSQSKEKKIEKKHAPKKTEAVIYGRNLSMSTKKSMGICKFIRGKTIPNAIADLEQVVRIRKVVPMKGEYAHQKGKGISSGKFPVKAAGIFINLLKSLSANANVSGLEEPIIFEAVANIAPRPFGKFGAVRKKRTHVKIVARNKKREDTRGEAKHSPRGKKSGKRVN